MRRGLEAPAQPAGRGRRLLRRMALAASLAALSLTASASPAEAVTIGQVSPSPGGSCGAQVDVLQPTVTSGNIYVVPSSTYNAPARVRGPVTSWRVTSWSHYARAGAGQMLAMKVFRKIADPATYMVVGHDGPRPLTGGVLNTFASSVEVMAGDVLGVNSANAATAPNACAFSAPGQPILSRLGDLADGGSGAFATNTGIRVNASALLVPSNAFSLGKVKRNKKRGTATLAVRVPNAGKLALSGKGIKAASAAGAVISKTVGAAGKVKLLIRAKGKKQKKLNRSGKVKVKVKITYTPPPGDDPATQTRKLKLKRKKR